MKGHLIGSILGTVVFALTTSFQVSLTQGFLQPKPSTFRFVGVHPSTLNQKSWRHQLPPEVSLQALQGSPIHNIDLAVLKLPSKTVNALGVFGGVAFLTLYHILLYRAEKAGKRTWRSAQADTREAWAKYVRESEGWLYAIQTLRNAITTQTFLATTVLSLLTVISGRLWDLIRSMPPGMPTRKTAMVQFTLVAASMLASGYQFLQSARLMTHAGFMFPVSAKTTKVDRIMRKSQNSQWAGLRFLYISSGLLSWIVGGPKVFFVFSALLTLFFRSIDQVPETLDDQRTYDI